ncbi:MAG: dihydroorotate dehydrogenase electron transfer subunit [Selenomonadaceae bacterium]|nr:dihydroorotate dehydrogenase electron transfer subunit [Selenomonadaceae bacterium]
MKQIYNARVVSNERAVDNLFRLVVELDAPLDAMPGQFVQLKLPSNEFTLRRPFGIARIKSPNQSRLTMFYRLVGRGTEFLSTVSEGVQLDLIAPLGNWFNFNVEEKILLVGGGVGLAPLLSVAFANGIADVSFCDVLIGGKTAAEVDMWMREFGGIVNEIFYTTDDGSAGLKGFVTDLLPRVLSMEKYDAVMVCGPTIMMKNVSAMVAQRGIRCEVSMERRMACGLGACLSCSIDTVNGRKKVCKDGPIFDASEIIF